MASFVDENQQYKSVTTEPTLIMHYGYVTCNASIIDNYVILWKFIYSIRLQNPYQDYWER